MIIHGLGIDLVVVDVVVEVEVVVLVVVLVEVVVVILVGATFDVWPVVLVENLVVVVAEFKYVNCVAKTANKSKSLFFN